VWQRGDWYRGHRSSTHFEGAHHLWPHVSLVNRKAWLVVAGDFPIMKKTLFQRINELYQLMNKQKPKPGEELYIRWLTPQQDEEMRKWWDNESGCNHHYVYQAGLRGCELCGHILDYDTPCEHRYVPQGTHKMGCLFCGHIIDHETLEDYDK
jgi:hypothetical protein